MAIHRILAFIILVFASSPATAKDRCVGAVMVARFHDAYLALLTETGPTRRNAAKTLLVIVGDRNAGAMARQFEASGQSVDEDRLLDTMESASTLAQDTLVNLPLPDDVFQHSQNVDWLGAIITGADCRDQFEASSAGFRTLSTNGEPAIRQGKMVRTDRPRSKTEEIYLFLVRFFGAVAVVGLAGYAIAKFRRSHTYRKQIVERMPRHPIKVELELTYTDPSGEMQQAKVSALDISTGGMKVNWPGNNAPSGTIVTVASPVGQKLASVMWSNAYYAGIMFEQLLTGKEFETFTSSSETET